MILLSENMGCLLPTIISRAQMVRFFPLRAVEAKNMLMRDYKLDPAKAHILSYISSGSIGEAIRLMDSGFFDKRARIVKSMIAKTSVDSELESSPKSDLDVYLNIALTYYRDMMVVKSGSSSAALINIDKKEDIINAAKRMKFDEIDEVIKQIILTGSYLDQNVNPKLAIASIGLSLAAK
jgi:DNA polymerase-3 subunit delta'